MRHLKAKALFDTLADRLTDVKALGEPEAQRYEGALINNLAYMQRWMDVETVNETVAEVKAQALVDTVRYAITYGSRRTWQHTRKKGGGLGSSGHTGRQTTTG